MPERLNLRDYQKLFISKGNRDWYITSVQQINKDTLHIAMPYQRAQPLLSNRGDEIFVRYAGDDATYSFKTSVLGLTEDKVPLYVLAKPGSVQRVQQRDFVRLPISIPVKCAVVEEDNDNLEYFKAYSIDISGGGMKLALNDPYRPGVELIVSFQLNSEGTPLDFKMHCKVVRLEVRKLDNKRRIFHTGVKFLNISPGEQDRIVAYIFSRMAKQKRLR